MKHRSGKFFACASAGAVFLLLFHINTALGIVLHPSGEPNLAIWTDRPFDDVVGRWGDSASCVAVSRNCVITTQHQGGYTETIVEIGGQSYEVEQIWYHSSADLRLAKLRNANLIHFVPLYSGVEQGKQLVIGGFGRGRGAELKTSGKTYGYQWLYSGNTTRRWCTNIVDSNDIAGGPWTSQVITADFDGLGEGAGTTYEGIPAAHDSGGGWFIKEANRWFVAGLSRAVAAHYVEGHEGDPAYQLSESWFRSRTNPNLRVPDYMDSVRVSSYASWITQTIPPVLAGDLTGDDYVDFSDFAVMAGYWLDTGCSIDNNWCRGSDFDQSAAVDWTDMAFLSERWLCDWNCN